MSKKLGDQLVIHRDKQQEANREIPTEKDKKEKKRCLESNLGMDPKGSEIVLTY